jgi:hypothetical protein
MRTDSPPPDCKHLFREQRFPTSPDRNRRKREHETFGDDVTQGAPSSTVHGAFGDHDGKRRFLFHAGPLIEFARIARSKATEAIVQQQGQYGTEQAVNRPDDVHDPHALRMVD